MVCSDFLLWLQNGQRYLKYEKNMNYIAGEFYFNLSRESWDLFITLAGVRKSWISIQLLDSFHMYNYI